MDKVTKKIKNFILFTLLFLVPMLVNAVGIKESILNFEYTTIFNYIFVIAIIFIPFLSCIKIQVLSNKLKKNNEIINKESNYKQKEETFKNFNLKEKQNSLVRLVSALSHEMNTPLGVLITSSTFLKEQSEDLLKKYKEKKLTESKLLNFLNSLNSSLNIIILNIHRASDLIKSFKDISTNDINETRTIELKSFYELIFNEISEKYKDKKINLILDFERMLIVDTITIFHYQVFSNLITNSFEHGFDCLTEGNISIKIIIEKEKIIYEYTDDGVKIPEDIIDKVFEPFFTTKRGIGNHFGLGLSIVYNTLTDVFNSTNIYVKNLEKGKMFSFEISTKNLILTKKNNLFIIKKRELEEHS